MSNLIQTPAINCRWAQTISGGPLQSRLFPASTWEGSRHNEISETASTEGNKQQTNTPTVKKKWQRTERGKTEVYSIMNDSEKISMEQLHNLFHNTGMRRYKMKFS